MRRPLRSIVSLLACVAALGSSAAVLSGCDDPRSLDWQVKHLSDTNPVERSKAIEGISQQWRATDQSGKDADKKAFKDKAIAELAKAYQSDGLKDASKDRKKIMDILSSAEDPRAKPAFLFAIKNYKAGETEDEVKASLRAIMKMKADPAFAGDADTGKAMVAGLGNVKWANANSGAVGALIGDAISGLKLKSTTMELLAIVTGPNDGQDNPATKEVTAKQIVCAQVLGEIGDASIVDKLIDVMFADAAVMAKHKDQTTGDEVSQASPLTTGVSMVIGNTLAKIGEPAIEPLMPFVKDDKSNKRVADVAATFKNYISPGGSGKATAYVDIATTTVANIGLPKVAVQIAGIVKDKKTKDTDRKPLIGLLVTLPADAVVIDALKEGYAQTDTSKLKSDIAGSIMRTMEPSMTDWLLGIALDKKTEDELAQSALSSAQWLAPLDKIDDVTKAYGTLKGEKGASFLEKRDNTWRAMEPTEKVCDPKTLKGEEKDRCAEEPEPKDEKNPKFVVWNDVTPTYKEEMGILADVLKCDKKAACYLDAFKAAVSDVDKQGLTKVTSVGTRAGIRMQKSIWMYAAYGNEDDMITLVNFMPNINTPAGRSFVQMALDKNLKLGSVKVADSITNLVKTLREKGSETANREASQLEPIANKLRARAAAAPNK